MHPELTIDLPDENRMEALRGQLHASDVDAVEVGAAWELRIRILASNRERGVTDALHAIDSWLSHGASVDFVRVHLDGSSYTMHAPRDRIAQAGSNSTIHSGPSPHSTRRASPAGSTRPVRRGRTRSPASSATGATISDIPNVKAHARTWLCTARAGCDQSTSA